VDTLRSDGELVLQSREDPDAFAEFYDRHAEDLLRYFARRTLDPDVAAAELTAETFAEAFASRFRYRERGAGAGPWLYGIARHELSRFFRAGAVQVRARQRLGIPERDVSDTDYKRIEELIDFEKVGRAIAGAMTELSAEQREAMTLRVIEGRPYEEVARMLACTEDTARARVSRGLKRLARLLDVGQPELEIGR
jgi:RNA polymerase sigma factor (sigma-70 family)